MYKADLRIDRGGKALNYKMGIRHDLLKMIASSCDVVESKDATAQYRAVVSEGIATIERLVRTEDSKLKRISVVMCLGDTEDKIGKAMSLLIREWNKETLCEGNITSYTKKEVVDGELKELSNKIVCDEGTGILELELNVNKNYRDMITLLVRLITRMLEE